MPPKYSDEDVDDLDDILDEFSKTPPPKLDPLSSSSQQQHPLPADKPTPPQSTTTAKGKAPNADDVEDTAFFSDDFAKEFAKQMEEMMRTLSTAESKSTDEPGATGDNDDDEAKKFKELWEKMIIEDLEADPRAPPSERPLSTQDPGSKSNNNNSSGGAEDPFQRTIREAMEKLRTSESDLRNQSGPNPPTNDNALESLLSSLGEDGEGEGEGLEIMLENMMSQLMSKEILYEPLKELHDKFPQYLRDNAKELSEEDKKRYEAQYNCVDRIINTFEDPGYSDDDPKYTMVVLEQMNMMQSHGSPPPAIMGEMPPGFDLGEDGLPKIPEGCIIA